jgi:hypothetical protein
MISTSFQTLQTCALAPAEQNVSTFPIATPDEVSCDDNGTETEHDLIVRPLRG